MIQPKKNNIRRSLAFKMILFIFLSIATIMMLIFSYNYNVNKDVVIRNLKNLANEKTENTVLKIDKVLSNIQSIPGNYMTLILSELGNETKMKYLLRQMVENNSDIYGAALAFEPYYRTPDEKYYSFYYYRDKNEVKFMHLGDSSYDYYTMDTSPSCNNRTSYLPDA